MAARPPDPVIVVPGITATYLRDDYPLPPEVVWSVMRSNYERVVLHPDNLRFEAAQPARIQPDQVFEIAYKELIAELRHNLSPSSDRPTPVYPFAYDWRQPLAETQKQLAGFVDEVLERTKLMRHYASSEWVDDPRVALVGHSMGGLVITGCLSSSAMQARVRKVVTLATPFRGSFEAVIKVITGTADLGTSAPSSREREAARLMPALYHLIPNFANGLVVEGDVDGPENLFNPELWQRSVVDTLKEFVAKHGLGRKAPREQAQELFAALLESARSHRGTVESFTLDKVGLGAEDWLCVVGADTETRVRLRVLAKPGRSEFVLSSRDRANLWRTGATPEERRLTGDGTVPLEGAIPGFLPESSLVVVTPKDFGYWELGDRGLAGLAGLHGLLPNMNLVHRLIVRHLTGATDKHKNTWGRRMPGSATWTPPLKQLHEADTD